MISTSDCGSLCVVIKNHLINNRSENLIDEHGRHAKFSGQQVQALSLCRLSIGIDSAQPPFGLEFAHLICDLKSSSEQCNQLFVDGINVLTKRLQLLQ